MSITDISFKGKVAVVTGGGTGMGRSIALELARAGADVVVASRKLANLEKVAGEIKALGRRSLALPMDVTKKDEVNKGFQVVMEKFGGIDILVNDAGGSARERSSLFCESTEDVWDYVLGINLKGVMNCTRAVINHMIAKRSGKIVNIASLAGTIGLLGRADYAAAKAAIIAFSISLAKEVAPYGVYVNCVSPGPIDRANRKMEEKTTKREEYMIQSTGLGRMGKPEEVASLAVFLLSDEANFITGQNYLICGLSNWNPEW